MSQHVPSEENRKMVETAAGIGLRHEMIATLLGITDKTLRRRYRKELDIGKAKAGFSVAKTIYDQALKGDRTMCIWWSKTQLGWRETVQIATPPGESLNHGAPGEAELIGAYFNRLDRIAAERGADPRARAGVGEARPGPEKPQSGEGAGEG